MSSQDICGQVLAMLRASGALRAGKAARGEIRVSLARAMRCKQAGPHVSTRTSACQSAVPRSVTDGAPRACLRTHAFA
eukprot:8216737-Alexandrium_andersonii.AAC.1